MAPLLQTQKGKRILQQCKILFPFCDPAGIQTQDLQNRNLTLYSAKLRSLVKTICSKMNNAKVRIFFRMTTKAIAILINWSLSR